METITVKIIRISHNLSLRCLVLALLFMGMCVNGYGQNSLNSGAFSSGSWGSGQTMSSSISGTLIITKNVTSSGDKYFRFYGDGSPCGEYQPALDGDAFTTGTTKTISGCGGSNAWKINVPNATDNVVFKTDGLNAGGSAICFVLGATPINVSTVTRDITIPNSTQATIVTATLTASLPAGQVPYLRYQTGGGFGTADIVTMTGSGTTYSATIPAQTVGTVVTYYVLTSGSVTPSNAEVDLRTISWNAGSQNGGSNYSYTVTAPPVGIITTGIITGSPFCAGATGILVPFTYTLLSSFTGSTFTVQLSDALGSFSSPTVLQNVTSNISGSQSIAISIPAGTPTGTGYRVRIVSNSPVATGLDNGVNITINATPTIANAGSDQISASTCGLTSVTLVGNTPTVGTGTWSIVSGTGGTFTGGAGNPGNSSIINPTFNGLAGNSYTLRWTVTNSPCTTSTDDVVITFNTSPTPSIAGSNQTICPSGTATLGSNTPTVGSGSWSVFSGPNTSSSQFSNTTATNAVFTPAGGSGSYVLRWTIANSPCTASTSDVIITVPPLFTYANLENTNLSLCVFSNATVYGQTYAAGITNAGGQAINSDIEIGYNSTNTDPSTWTTWTNTNVGYVGETGNNDRFQAQFGSSLTIGTYYYTFRFRLNGCAWQYGGYNSGGGGFWNGTSNVNGVLTVNNTSPTVTTPTSTALTTTTATLGGDATSIGCSTITERGIYYSTTNGFLDGAGTKIATTGTFSSGVFTQAVTGLAIATTYYYKAFATNSGGTTYTTQGTFSTISPAIVSTTVATAITATTASSGGNVTADGGTTVTAKGVIYSTTSGPLLGGSGVITSAGGTGLGSFTSNLTGLNPGTTYYLNSYATNTTGTAYGTQISFTTLATPPVLAATTTATLIYCHNATSGGNVIADGGSIITERGIVFATTSNPTTSNTKVIASGTTGVFTTNLASLTSQTLYYVRTYAINSAGTTYGTQISFTTSAAPTALSSDFYSDRIYFKNGSNASEKYYLENNSVPNGGCTGAATETAGTAAWETRNLGSSIAGTTLQLGSFLVSKGKSNGNTPKINYRMYLTSTGPGALSFTQLSMNYVAECDADGVLVNSNTEDKIWRNPLADITAPTTPGNYTIEIYYERQGDQLGAGGSVYMSNCGANYKATIDIIRPTGIFSDAIYFDNGTTVTNHTAAGYDSCNTSLTIESGKWNGKDLGSLDPGKVLKISATVLTLDGASPVVDGSTNFFYRIYKNGAAIPAYTTMTLPVVTGLLCGDTNISKFDQPTLATLYTTTASNGTYSIELYYSALLTNGTTLTRGTSSTPYKATFSILAATPSGERDPNDGNYDPTATNTSGMFESYMGVLVNDDTGAPITGLNRVFDMDGALSSSNSSNFDFGTQNPGLDFNVGTETKVFTKGTHKVCGCSSWNYVYKDGTADPIATDFPLPVAGSLFTDQINGKFTLLNSSDNINSNGMFIKQVYPAPNVTAAGSTSDSSYNSSLGTTITQFKDYTDPAVGTVSTINTPVFPVLCPTCSGPYRVAVAMLSWVSTTGDCSNPASFIYHRDINRNKVTDSRVVLNPNHNDAPTSGTGNPSKNSLPGTSLFYISKVNIGATGGTRTWNGSWSGSVPTSKNDVIIASNYSTAGGSFTCNDITINTGVVVTIKDDTYIEALNNATTTGTGKVVIENKGNFVQRCDEKSPSAYIEHTKTTEIKKNWDYEYWGSPIAQDILTTSLPSAFDRAYYWDGGNGGTGWKTATTGSITTGKGLITRVANITPYNATPTAITWLLSGTANNGIYTTPVKDYTAWSGGDAYLDYLDYALIANPYACALDGKTFLSNPRNDVIGKTLYFWTAITPIAKTQYLTDDPWAYNYNPEDYAAWNFTGGVATQTKAATDISGTDILKPTGKIASGQAFFVEVLDNGTAYFDNSMRLTAGNNQFFKHATLGNKPSTTNRTFPIKPPGLEEGRVWINISNTSSFRQMLVGYVHGATNDFDPFYDGELYSDSPVLIYTSINDKDYTIQGRQLPFDENESIPIGIDALEGGEFYISIDEVDGFFNHQNVILKDNSLGIEHDLKQTAYKFTTNAGRFDNRFELKFTGKSGELLGVPQEKNNADAVLVFVQNNQLKVTSSIEEITAITVFDISGKKILTKNTINKKELILDKLSKQNQVILVKIKLANNTEITKKALF